MRFAAVIVMIRNTRNRIRNNPARNFAIANDAPAMVVNPRSAARSPITRNTRAMWSMSVTLRWLILPNACRAEPQRANRPLQLLNLEPPAAAHLARRRLQHDFEHAILEGRLGTVGNGAFRQRHGAVEAAVASLVAIHALPFLFVLLLALALNRQHIVVDLDLNVFLPEARQIGADDEIVSA